MVPAREEMGNKSNFQLLPYSMTVDANIEMR